MIYCCLTPGDVSLCADRLLMKRDAPRQGSVRQNKSGNCDPGNTNTHDLKEAKPLAKALLDELQA